MVDADTMKCKRHRISSYVIRFSIPLVAHLRCGLIDVLCVLKRLVFEDFFEAYISIGVQLFGLEQSSHLQVYL